MLLQLFHYLELKCLETDFSTEALKDLCNKMLHDNHLFLANFEQESVLKDQKLTYKLENALNKFFFSH